LSGNLIAELAAFLTVGAIFAIILVLEKRDARRNRIVQCDDVYRNERGGA
jgi:hypothetical protein